MIYLTQDKTSDLSCACQGVFLCNEQKLLKMRLQSVVDLLKIQNKVGKLKTGIKAAVTPISISHYTRYIRQALQTDQQFYPPNVSPINFDMFEKTSPEQAVS